MAMGLLADRLAQSDSKGIVRSAGFARADVPVHPYAFECMRERSIDIGSHRSAVLGREWIVGPEFVPDVVVGMAREHVRNIVLLERSAWSRTFTLKELVRRAAAVGRREPGQSPAEWIGEVAEGRQLAAMLGDDPDDDVADPMGRSPATFARTAAEIEDLVDRFVALARL